MISIFNISSFLIIFYTLITGGRNILILILLFFSYYLFRKSTFDKFRLTNDTLLVLFFAFFYPLGAILDNSLSFSNLDLVEWKVYVVIIVISLLSLEKENNNKITNLNNNLQLYKHLNFKLGNILFLSIILFTIICLYQVFPSFYRFADYAPIAGDIISNYFGFFCLFAASLVKNILFKYILYSLILIGGGGSSIIGLIIYITTFYLTKTNMNLNKRILATLLGTLISFSIFFPIFEYSQLQRGRSISNLENVDRFIILKFFSKYLTENFNTTNYFFGVGPDSAIDIKNIMQRYSISSNETAIGKYLIRRFDVVSGKSLHNDYLRIFLHYGFLGLFIFLRYTYKLFSYDISFYFSFLFISFFNGVTSATSCSSIIILIFLIKGIKTLKFKKNNYT